MKNEEQYFHWLAYLGYLDGGIGDESNRHHEDEELPHDIPEAADHHGGQEAGAGQNLVPADARGPWELHEDQGERGDG